MRKKRAQLRGLSVLLIGGVCLSVTPTRANPPDDLEGTGVSTFDDQPRHLVIPGESQASAVRTPEYSSRFEASQEAPPELQKIIATEPTPKQLLKQVESYLKLHEKDMKSIRRRSRARAVAPLLAIGARISQIDGNLNSEQLPSPVLLDQRNNTRDLSANIGILWDLRDSAFNAAEIDLYSVTDLRRRILTEASRIFLARRLLQIDLYLEDLTLRRRMQIEARIADYTASLDAVSGGWFSEAIHATQ